MSDVDEFADTQPKQWALQKQERFEQRVLLSLCRHLEDKPGLAKKLAWALGDDFKCTWLNRNNFPVGLSAYKAAKPIQTSVLLRNPRKLPVFRELEELAANYPDAEWAIIFASDGDGLPEMVIHTRVDWDAQPGYWRILLPEGSMELEGADGMISRRWVVDPLDGFAAAMKANSSWCVDEQMVGETE